MKNFKYRIITLLIAIFGVLSVEASAKDINGYYLANDGGAYFIRQTGSKIYWIGEDPKGGYANVFAGTVTGTKITGQWWDVPKGKARGGGQLTLEIKGNQIVKISSSVPFGVVSMVDAEATSPIKGLPGLASVTDVAVSVLRSRPEGFREETTLTGAWSGDDLSTYYIRETGDGDVVWLAENNAWGGQGGLARPAYARVFIGKRVKGYVIGSWIDLPKGKSASSGAMGVQVKSAQDLHVNNSPPGISTSKLWRSLPTSLRGFADLHTHPMVHLALGRKFIHGAPDVGSIVPADSDCVMNVKAKSIAHALGKDNSTHGGTGWFGIDNRCGDNIRQGVLDSFQSGNKGLVTPDNAVGYPTFKDYPKYNDLTHQKMWVDWIRRSYDGGQRVMVALAMNNQTLASAVSGPGDGPVTDKESADLQIDEMKRFAKRHDDFMEIAYSGADVRRIVAANKMAIILGVEIDNIGNFINFKQNPKGSATGEYLDNKTTSATDAEIDRLYDLGVRYVFPIHLIDNLYGGTAIYQDLFNLSNYHVRHKYWSIECSGKNDGITKKFKVDGFDVVLAAAKAFKLGIDIASFPPDPPPCTSADRGSGHVNTYGLDAGLGEHLVKKLMSKGMLIDIDHASVKAINRIFTLAEAVPGGYPLVSGHTGLRADLKNENSRTPEQLAKLGRLGGMFGLGSDDVKSTAWASQYVEATKQMGANSEGRVSFGSDLNGLVKGAKPAVGIGTLIASTSPVQASKQFAQMVHACESIYDAGFSMSTTGDKKWSYCSEGVVHYGMLPDFLRQINTVEDGNLVNTGIMKNAEVFAKMWEKAEGADPRSNRS